MQNCHAVAMYLQKAIEDTGYFIIISARDPVPMLPLATFSLKSEYRLNGCAASSGRTCLSFCATWELLVSREVNPRESHDTGYSITIIVSSRNPLSLLPFAITRACLGVAQTRLLLLLKSASMGLHQHVIVYSAMTGLHVYCVASKGLRMLSLLGGTGEIGSPRHVRFRWPRLVCRYDEFDVADRLRQRGWVVPAYTMAPGAEVSAAAP
jgi:hypothetical protein